MLNNHSLFHEPIEELTSVLGGPAIEPECELIQVAIELPPRHSSVMASQQPALQKGRDPVDAGEECRGGLAAASDDPGPVLVPLLLQSFVPLPSIRDYDGSWLDSPRHEPSEASGRRVWNAAQADASDALPIDLRGDRHQSLVSQVPAASSRFYATHVRFVHLHCPRQAISPRPHHRVPELLEAGPGRLVAPQAQQALQAQGADAVLLVGHPPHRQKPGTKRKMAPMKDRPGSDRRLVSARGAFDQTTSHGPVPAATTSRATEAAGPAQLDQVSATALFRGKPAFELGKRVRIIFHTTYHYP